MYTIHFSQDPRKLSVCKFAEKVILSIPYKAATVSSQSVFVGGGTCSYFVLAFLMVTIFLIGIYLRQIDELQC